MTCFQATSNVTGNLTLGLILEADTVALVANTPGAVLGVITPLYTNTEDNDYRLTVKDAVLNVSPKGYSTCVLSLANSILSKHIDLESVTVNLILDVPDVSGLNLYYSFSTAVSGASTVAGEFLGATLLPADPIELQLAGTGKLTALRPLGTADSGLILAATGTLNGLRPLSADSTAFILDVPDTKLNYHAGLSATTNLLLGIPDALLFELDDLKPEEILLTLATADARLDRFVNLPVAQYENLFANSNVLTGAGVSSEPTIAIPPGFPSGYYSVYEPQRIPGGTTSSQVADIHEIRQFTKYTYTRWINRTELTGNIPNITVAFSSAAVSWNVGISSTPANAFSISSATIAPAHSITAQINSVGSAWWLLVVDVSIGELSTQNITPTVTFTPASGGAVATFGGQLARQRTYTYPVLNYFLFTPYQSSPQIGIATDLEVDFTVLSAYAGLGLASAAFSLTADADLDIFHFLDSGSAALTLDTVDVDNFFALRPLGLAGATLSCNTADATLGKIIASLAGNSTCALSASGPLAVSPTATAALSFFLNNVEAAFTVLRAMQCDTATAALGQGVINLSVENNQLFTGTVTATSSTSVAIALLDLLEVNSPAVSLVLDSTAELEKLVWVTIGPADVKVVGLAGTLADAELNYFAALDAEVTTLVTASSAVLDVSPTGSIDFVCAVNTPTLYAVSVLTSIVSAESTVSNIFGFQVPLVSDVIPLTVGSSVTAGGFQSWIADTAGVALTLGQEAVTLVHIGLKYLDTASATNVLNVPSVHLASGGYLLDAFTQIQEIIRYPVPTGTSIAVITDTDGAQVYPTQDVFGMQVFTIGNDIASTVISVNSYVGALGALEEYPIRPTYSADLVLLRVSLLDTASVQAALFGSAFYEDALVTREAAYSTFPTTYTGRVSAMGSGGATVLAEAAGYSAADTYTYNPQPSGLKDVSAMLVLSSALVRHNYGTATAINPEKTVAVATDFKLTTMANKLAKARMESSVGLYDEGAAPIYSTAAFKLLHKYASNELESSSDKSTGVDAQCAVVPLDDNTSFTANIHSSDAAFVCLPIYTILQHFYTAYCPTDVTPAGTILMSSVGHGDSFYTSKLRVTADGAEVQTSLPSYPKTKVVKYSKTFLDGVTYPLQSTILGLDSLSNLHVATPEQIIGSAPISGTVGEDTGTPPTLGNITAYTETTLFAHAMQGYTTLQLGGSKLLLLGEFSITIDSDAVAADENWYIQVKLVGRKGYSTGGSSTEYVLKTFTVTGSGSQPTALDDNIHFAETFIALDRIPDRYTEIERTYFYAVKVVTSPNVFCKVNSASLVGLELGVDSLLQDHDTATLNVPDFAIRTVAAANLPSVTLGTFGTVSVSSQQALVNGIALDLSQPVSADMYLRNEYDSLVRLESVFDSGLKTICSGYLANPAGYDPITNFGDINIPKSFYKAETGLTVSAWTSQVTYATISYSLLQADSAKQGTILTDDINSYDALSLASGKYMSTAVQPAAHTPFTLCFVMKKTSIASSHYCFFGNHYVVEPGALHRTQGLGFNTGRPIVFANGQFYRESANSTTLSTSAYSIVCCSFDGSSAVPTIRVNGTQLANVVADSTTLVNSTTATTGYHLKNNLVGVGAVSYGDSNDIVAESLVFERYLSGAKVKVIEGYMAHKFALTGNLPSTHPYKTTAPAVDEVTPIKALGLYDTPAIEFETNKLLAATPTKGETWLALHNIHVQHSGYRVDSSGAILNHHAPLISELQIRVNQSPKLYADPIQLVSSVVDVVTDVGFTVISQDIMYPADDFALALATNTPTLKKLVPLEAQTITLTSEVVLTDNLRLIAGMTGTAAATLGFFASGCCNQYGCFCVTTDPPNLFVITPGLQTPGVTLASSATVDGFNVFKGIIFASAKGKLQTTADMSRTLSLGTASTNSSLASNTPAIVFQVVKMEGVSSCAFNVAYCAALETPPVPPRKFTFVPRGVS